MNPGAPKRSIKYEIRLRPHEDAAIRATAQELQITVTEALRGWIFGGLRAGIIPDCAIPPDPQPADASAVEAELPA